MTIKTSTGSSKTELSSRGKRPFKVRRSGANYGPCPSANFKHFDFCLMLEVSKLQASRMQNAWSSCLFITLIQSQKPRSCTKNRFPSGWRLIAQLGWGFGWMNWDKWGYEILFYCRGGAKHHSISRWQNTQPSLSQFIHPKPHPDGAISIHPLGWSSECSSQWLKSCTYTRTRTCTCTER